MTEQARGEREAASPASGGWMPGRTVASGSSGFAEACRRAVNRSNKVCRAGVS